MSALSSPEMRVVVAVCFLLCTHLVNVDAAGSRLGKTVNTPSLGREKSNPFTIGNIDPDHDPRPTHKGYLKVDDDGSELYYAYWEAQRPDLYLARAPIILWLQGGPGCASTFGGFYELGPYQVTEFLELITNSGSWAYSHGLLLIDQPLGTGYSRPAHNDSIPRTELGMATHLYAALQSFYTIHKATMGMRPLFITGESYGGKYVPSMAHYILQAQDMYSSSRSAESQGQHGSGSSGSSSADNGKRTSSSSSSSSSSRALPTGSGSSALLPSSGGELSMWRRLPADIPPPVFKLAGIAIGNGLTDPRAQVPVMSNAAYYMGLVPPAMREVIAKKAEEVVALIDSKSWLEAHNKREALRGFITNVTGIATMFDTRRDHEYDAKKTIDRFLNLFDVKEAMGAHQKIDYKSCNDVVGEIMAADTMQSVKHLLPDVLARLPVLLYQGQFDILDGVASSIAWIDSMEWPLQQQLADDPGTLWSNGGRVAGWQRAAGNLTHAVVYRAGHMVPHDQPEAMRALMEAWVQSIVHPYTPLSPGMPR